MQVLLALRTTSHALDAEGMLRPVPCAGVYGTDNMCPSAGFVKVCRPSLGPLPFANRQQSRSRAGVTADMSDDESESAPLLRYVRLAGCCKALFPCHITLCKPRQLDQPLLTRPPVMILSYHTHWLCQLRHPQCLQPQQQQAPHLPPRTRRRCGRMHALSAKTRYITP